MNLLSYRIRDLYPQPRNVSSRSIRITVLLALTTPRRSQGGNHG